jgi:acetyl esterase
MVAAREHSLNGPPLSQLSPAAAHVVLTDLQSQPMPLPDAQIEDVVWPVGPTGETRIRIVRPATAGATKILPVILSTDGGGWVHL